MSTTTLAVQTPAAEPTGAGPRRLAGAGTLVRFLLRRDRVKMPAWLGALGLFVIYIGAALPQLAPTEEDLPAVAPIFTQPLGRMFSGPAYGLDAPTYERFFAAGYVPYLIILAALMNILLITRHTRAEEQHGRSELVRASVVGRSAQLTAALLVALIADVVAMAVIYGLALAQGFDPVGSVLIGATVAVTGLVFASLAAVTVQLTEYSRSAAGYAGLLLGLAFVLRAQGDMAQIGGSALSWASPLGWAAQTAPYVHDRWWPLLPALALIGGAVALAFALQSRRDLGAGLLPARRGRTTASPSLGSPLGLAARLQRGPALAWGTAIIGFGVVNGAFAEVMVDGAADLPESMVEMFGTGALQDGYLAFLAVFSGYLAAAYVVFAVHALRGEETGNRAEAVLATPVSRAAWAGAHLLVIAGAAALIMLVAGLGTGAAAAMVTGDSALGRDATLAHVNLLPTVMLVLGVCAVLFGWMPPLLTILGWSLVALMVFIGNFASPLDVPAWVQDLSPLSHPAQMPVESFTAAPPVVLAALAVVGVGVGLAGLRRREVGTR